MQCFSAKRDLYHRVNDLRRELGVSLNDYPITVKDICSKYAIIGDAPFENRALRGLVHFGAELGKPDVILLNSNRSDTERNFDCGHELIHLFFHRYEQKQSFSCLDSVSKSQNSFLEWQANEGAAQLIIPMELLLPKIRFKKFYSQYSFERFIRDLAYDFGVTSKVMEFRLDSLKYEIYQYCNNVPIESIEILAHKEQERLKIKVPSFSDMQNQIREQEIKRFLQAVPSASKKVNSVNKDCPIPMSRDLAVSFAKAEEQYLYDV